MWLETQFFTLIADFWPHWFLLFRKIHFGKVQPNQVATKLYNSLVLGFVHIPRRKQYNIAQIVIPNAYNIHKSYQELCEMERHDTLDLMLLAHGPIGLWIFMIQKMFRSDILFCSWVLVIAHGIHVATLHKHTIGPHSVCATQHVPWTSFDSLISLHFHRIKNLCGWRETV